MRMDVLEPTDELVREHQYCFEGKFATAVVEEILQTRSKQIKNHGIILALGHVQVNSRNSDTTRKRLVDLGFSFEKRGIGLDVFEFDGNILAGVDVGSLDGERVARDSDQTRLLVPTYVHIAKGTTTDPLLQPIFTTHA